MAWFFVFFFVSGFCSILYELVWLRLSMAEFGVTSALVSIVLSMFMAGLGLGSWISGRLLRKYGEAPTLRFYAVSELLIGTSAVLVPHQLVLGRRLLQHLDVSLSFSYYLASAAWLALTLVPWCAFMGATIPIGMQAIRQYFSQESPRAFSYLYLANVLGAVAGATIPLLLIEAYGFRGTLRVGAMLNGLLALSAMLMALKRPVAQQVVAQDAVSQKKTAPRSTSPVVALDQRSVGGTKLLVLLFMTGLTSMGMEVVWIREFTPYLSTVVYSFASILGLYLFSTFVGSRIYRHWSQRHTHEDMAVWILLGLFALFPLVTANPKFHLSNLVRLAFGIAPFSAVLGFVTPMLVDRWSGGDPDKAGRAYAVNVVGCILGPLLAGFVLLPLLSERWVLFVLALPWLAIGLNPRWSSETGRWRRKLAIVVGLLTILVILTSKDYESRFAQREVLRDHTATIIAAGEGMERRLFVNGIGITALAPVTKMMAHLPLAFLDHQPRNALVVCFGMGTSYRSLLSWNIPATAVELVPSVPRLFWYFHADAPELLRSPRSHVVIDDGRRYLERTSEQYDVITIDPPPPVEAAGSSLLYSKEFYATVKQRLRPDGILQQWLPRGDAVDHAAVARALQESFPYVRAFYVNPETKWGTHYLAGMQPIPNWTAAELAQHMPQSAARDLIEWGPEGNAANQFAALLKKETSIDQMIAEAPATPALQDDRPMNEYYLIRQRILPVAKRYF
jgi:spermidine synthase